ncbi:MAG TPA: trigger factor [Pyrinomonadaceae bacterium]|nr:trigger factor [Pyrinomonadaceae bacterium]
MKSELTDVSPTRKEIKIEIEPARVRDTYDRISDEFIRKAKVPGFRDGHAPRSVVRTRYKNEIRTEVLRELVPDAVNDAIIEHSLDAIGEPDVHFENEETLERLGEESITVKVGIEVPPEVTLGDYKGLAATRKTRPVTDDDINQTIESLREGLAAMVPVEDRGSELGDTVTINALGKEIDQPDAEEIKVDDIEVVLGGPNVQKEFTENLTGVKPDDKKTFTVEYPADFSTPQLAGKKVEYEMEVTAVRRRELPEVDDEWAKSVGEEFDSVDTLKKRIREDLEARANAESDNKLRADLIRSLVSAHQFEVPESWVEKQTNQRFESVLRDMMSRGVDPRQQNVNWEGARAELKVQAEEDVRATLLMERIAETENLTVSDEEVEAEIELMAQMARQPIEQMRAALTKHGGERSIAQRLRNRKALDLLVEKATITDADWNESNEASAAASNE